MPRAIGQPVLVHPDQPSRVLEPIRLGKGTTFDESWLQRILIDHPQALPISDIEPGFAPLIPVAREVPCGHGYIDNLYLTGNGEVVLVEAKLWANPQARREVVAQTLDYVAALSQMDFETFEREVLKGQVTIDSPRNLYQFVADQADVLDERDFIDAVAANLRRGRILALAVGDGIRQEAEALGDLLQSHGGAHFTFALVELASYRTHDGAILLVPRTLVRTAMVERAVVRIEEGRIAVEAVAPVTPRGTVAETISDKAFFEAMATRDPALPDALRAFIASLEPLGVYRELRASMNLKWDPGNGRPVNLGYIQRNGQLWTTPVAWATSQEIAQRYSEALAALIDGQPALNAKGVDPYVSTNGKSAPRIEQFIPANAEGWRQAIMRLQAEVRDAGNAADD